MSVSLFLLNLYMKLCRQNNRFFRPKASFLIFFSAGAC